MSDKYFLNPLDSALLDSLFEQIVVIDKFGKIIQSNRAWRESARLRGAKADAVSAGASYLDVLEKAARTDGAVARILEGIKGVLDGAIAQFDEEYECTSEAECCFFLQRVTPLKHPIGGAVIAHLNVTNQKLAENDRDARRMELERATRFSTIGQLSGAIAHELSQPLAAIRANAQVARAAIDKDLSITEIGAILEDIEIDSGRAALIINRLRDLLGHPSPGLEIVDVNDVIENTLTLCSRELSAHDIRLVLSLTRELPPIRGDSIGLQQVILNLVINACEAMASAEKLERRLEISTLRKDSKRLVVVVADSGPGLSKESTNRLFEPLFTTKDEGIGLGLFVSRSIVNAHAGILSLASRESGGAVAEIELPIKEIAS